MGRPYFSIKSAVQNYVCRTLCAVKNTPELGKHDGFFLMYSVEYEPKMAVHICPNSTICDY